MSPPMIVSHGDNMDEKELNKIFSGAFKALAELDETTEKLISGYTVEKSAQKGGEKHE